MTEEQDKKNPTKKQNRVPRSPTVIVRITQDTIDQSIRRHSSHCMIAEAIAGAVPSARSVAVDLATVRWSDPERGLRYVYLTPRPAQIALIHYDRGEIPKPFEVKLSKAQVTRIPGPGMSGGRKAPAREWNPLKEAVNSARQGGAIDIADIATETELSESSIRSYLNPGADIPTKGAVEKLKAFAARHPDSVVVGPYQPATEREIKSQAHLVPKGPRQFRHQDSSMEIVGGRPLPVGNLGRRRAFGLRSFIE